MTARAAATMPHTLRDVTAAGKETAPLTMPAGSGPVLARQDGPDRRAASGARAHPDPAPPSRPSWDPAPVPATRSWRPSPPGAAPASLSTAGPPRITAGLKEHGCRHSAWAQQARDAPDKQTVTVAGTDAAGAVPPHPAHPAHLPARPEDRAPRPGPGGRLHPLPPGPPPPAPGTRAPTTAVLPAKTPGRTPTTRTQPAPHAGLAPATRRSGAPSGARGASHTGSKRLKTAMLNPALASLRPDPVSRAYYQRKRDQANARARPSQPLPTATS